MVLVFQQCNYFWKVTQNPRRHVVVFYAFLFVFLILQVNLFAVILDGEIVSFFFDILRGGKQAFIEDLKFNEKASLKEKKRKERIQFCWILLSIMIAYLWDYLRIAFKGGFFSFQLMNSFLKDFLAICERTSVSG